MLTWETKQMQGAGTITEHLTVLSFLYTFSLLELSFTYGVEPTVPEGRAQSIDPRRATVLAYNRFHHRSRHWPAHGSPLFPYLIFTA